MARYEGQAVIWRQKHRQWHKQDVATFCDALAEGGTIAAAATACGRSRSWGTNTFAHIRRQLGPQAV